ncbi:MAG: AI-2E family transporter [Kiritimatiellae bacterium]|nr:AI-2E family transporter [Kiritimatiellia bacterium]
MSKINDWLLKIASIAIIMLGLKYASALITQILIIIFIAVIISPIYYWLRRLRFPNWLALITLIVSMVCFTLFGIISFITQTIQKFADKVPDYYTQFIQIVRDVSSWLSNHDVYVPEKVIDYIATFGLDQIMPVVKGVTPLMVSMLQQIIVVLIVVSFILCELNSLPRKVRSIRWVDKDVYDRMLRMVLDIRHYMGIKTIISAATGFFIYLGLKLLGVPSAEALGLLAFILNFVPVFGSILATIPAVILASINSGDSGIVVYVIFLYLVVNQVLGNILEPKFMGKGFGISPVIVLIAVLIWGWTLGPIGMLLAVPLTMAVKSSFDSLRKEELAQKIKDVAKESSSKENQLDKE